MRIGIVEWKYLFDCFFGRVFRVILLCIEVWSFFSLEGYFVEIFENIKFLNSMGDKNFVV